MNKGELVKIFKTEQNLDRLIKSVANDRINQSNESLTLLKELLQDNLSNPNFVNNGVANQSLAEKNPLLFILLTLILEEKKQDVDSTNLRDKAADAYKKIYEDERFERHYFYSKSPLPVLAHILMMAKVWKAVYDDQMMGIYSGTMCFEKDEVISKETINIILNKIPETEQTKLLSTLEDQKNDKYKATRWISTPVLDEGLEGRLNRLYTADRRKKQNMFIEGYLKQLHNTSEKIGATLENREKSNALLIIGPYGSGKTTYLEREFGIQEEEKGFLTTLSVDALNKYIVDHSVGIEGASRLDFHFEAAILKNTIDPSKIKNLFVIGVYIDNFRFDRAIERDYAGRNIKIVEIAPETPQAAVLQLCRRDGITDSTNKNFTQTLDSANDAQVNRKSRIEKVQQHPNVEYTLICNKHTENADPCFVEVCTVKNGKLIIIDQTFYTELTKEYKATKENVESLLKPSNQNDTNSSSPNFKMKF